MFLQKCIVVTNSECSDARSRVVSQFFIIVMPFLLQRLATEWATNTVKFLRVKVIIIFNLYNCSTSPVLQVP